MHLTRRARGLPLWMSLLANGAGAYRDAVNYCLDLAEHAAQQIEGSEHLELVGEPSLSVVLFRRRGWEAQQYVAWSAAARAAGVLITPTWRRARRRCGCVSSTRCSPRNSWTPSSPTWTRGTEPDDLRIAAPGPISTSRRLNMNMSGGR